MARSDSAAAVRRGLVPEGERPVLVTRRHPGHIGKEGVTETSVSVQRPSAASLVGLRTNSCFCRSQVQPPTEKLLALGKKAAPGNIVKVGIETLAQASKALQL